MLRLTQRFCIRSAMLFEVSGVTAPLWLLPLVAFAISFFTSVAGVVLYQFLPAPTGVETRPDWALGILFGLGGAAGMYFGARMQKRVPQLALKAGLAAVLSLLAVQYLGQFLAR